MTRLPPFINVEAILEVREGSRLREPIRSIKIGTDDFNKIRDKNAYYVDKTALIDDIINLDSEVYLFTRPRRFGKSLNLSMLDSYFNLRYANDPDRFAGLRISELRPNDTEKNSNPVVHLNLKDLKAPDYGWFLKALGGKMSRLYRMFPELKESDLLDERQKQIYNEIFMEHADETLLSSSLGHLTEMIETVYGKPVIVLIDEYDNAVNEAATSEMRSSILGFYSVFLSNALKSNRSLKFAVLTGVMQIAKASIFSGLNNLYTDSIFDTRFQEYWGFSEDEVKRLCADFGHPEMFEEAKEWYDGYRFGTAEVYNPWSVLNYVVSGFVPKEYWANNSTNSILEDLYRRADISDLKDLIDIAGDGIVKALYTTITYSDAENDDESLYSVMAMTGYLKAVSEGNGLYRLSVPNNEVRKLVSVKLSSLSRIGQTGFNIFCTSIANGDADTVERVLGEILLGGSYWNLTEERSYELVIMTILYGISERFRIRTEQEGGNGRIDIIMEPKAAGRAGMIIELKKVDSEAELEGAASAALSQIHEKRYYLGMRGTVLLYGISFCGKIPCVKHERLELQ